MILKIKEYSSFCSVCVELFGIPCDRSPFVVAVKSKIYNAQCNIHIDCKCINGRKLQTKHVIVIEK